MRTSGLSFHRLRMEDVRIDSTPRVRSIGRMGGLKWHWLWFDRSQVKAYALMMAGRMV